MPSEKRVCQNCKKEFTVEPDDFGFYEKMRVPPPTFCPECRMIRRMSWRNENALYRRKCDLCEKTIITMYAPESPFQVYCHECWTSDRWDGKDYGGECDWSKPFFVQFRSLLEKVPLVLADIKGTMVNSEYGNYNGSCKNCYMCFSSILSEDSLYCTSSQELKQCLDSIYLQNGELCYEAIDSEKNYRCSFIEKTKESTDSSFLSGCSNVSHCFMSANLRNKNYVFRNEQLAAEEYAARMDKIDFGGFIAIEKLKGEFTELKKSALCKYAEMKNSVDATGNNITNSKHVRYSFTVDESENVKYSIRALKGCRDVYDCQGIVSGELACEGSGCGFSSQNALFSFSFDVCKDIQYCAMCRDCSDCFGCVGLKNQSYCIFNRQCSKEEYQKLVPKIIDHMGAMPYVDSKGRAYKYGEFFPQDLSLFAYNETLAQDYFPLDKETAEARGYRWREEGKREYSVTLHPKDIPDRIKDVDDSILGEVIGCEHADSKNVCNERCSTAFKLAPQELQFYRQCNIPIPHLCPNCRYAIRLKQRNPLKLWHRTCMCNLKTHTHGAEKCLNEFETSYAPDRPEIVYCENCYNSEVA